MGKAILTINAGSSSLKFSIYRIEDDGRLDLKFKGLVSALDQNPVLKIETASGDQAGRHTWPKECPQFSEVLSTVLDRCETLLGSDTLLAVGHRVVHGGREHTSPERVTPLLLETLTRLTPLAPLHEPHNLHPIYLLAGLRPELPQVACFDTAFHHSLPPVATRFGLPRTYEADGLRRYGFHGLSYEYIAEKLKTVSPRLANGRVIAAHLGSGASLCALKSGRSIETTMGFTALDGLLMSTRCGSLDPGAILFLAQTEKMTPAQLSELLYTRSGLLGVSGLSGDLRVLLDSNDPHAREAIELFVYRIVKEIGALTAVLGGLDGLVFTAGIGEHAFQIRQMVCDQLAWLGVAIDAQANRNNALKIGTAQSQTEVWVIPTDEELVIAQHTRDVCRKEP
ncbi:Acetate kinase OS=Afipia felis OX=1035 GN=pduW PE=3 SV=1 [Afipia felis]